MKHEQKNLLIASLMVLFGASAQAQGMGGPGPGMGPGMGAGMGRMAQGDPAKFEAQRAARHAQVMANLKTRLQLTSAQESAWTTFAAAMQPSPRMASDRAQFRAEMDKLTTPERIEKMQAFKAQRDAEMTRRADATKTFYATLSPEQKKTFDTDTAAMIHRGGIAAVADRAPAWAWAAWVAWEWVPAWDTARARLATDRQDISAPWAQAARA
mgnify:CR=1 FL=1